MASSQNNNNENEISSKKLKELFKDGEDISFREIQINGITIHVVFIDGLVNNITTSDYILKPLFQDRRFSFSRNELEIIKLIQAGTIYFSSQNTRNNISDVVLDVLDGSTALIFDREKTAITFNNKSLYTRAITEPSGENVIKGSKDTFVETLRVNTATIRRKIKSENLKIQNMIIGERTQTFIDVFYMDNIVNKLMLEELKQRLSKIKVDGVLTTGFIEEFIVEERSTLFPQIIYTERPDKFCADLIEGYIGIIVDGIPLGLIMPATLLQCLQAPEDYAQNHIVSSLIRYMRFNLMLLTLVLPAFYTALTTFHQEMIPSKLALSIQASKEGVPFPSFIEVLFMLASFEILVESAIRLPKTIGQAISIVGAIVVGQAAVEAKLVSPAVVVVIALTAISSFSMPNQDFANVLRVWRFIFVILSSILGLCGLTLGLLVLLTHLASIEVLGVPYLAPFVSGEYKNLDDSIFRCLLPFQKKRPKELSTQDEKRR